MSLVDTEEPSSSLHLETASSIFSEDSPTCRVIPYAGTLSKKFQIEAIHLAHGY